LDTDLDETFLQRWYELGAEAWDSESTVRGEMLDLYWMVNPKAPEFDARTTDQQKPSGRGFIVIGLKPRRGEGETN
jgi:hypothetical protein